MPSVTCGQSPHLELPPSEYFKRQGYATFGDDLAGLLTRELTGTDCLMWGSDYPHDEGTFPHSQEVIDRIFKDIPEDEKREDRRGGMRPDCMAFPCLD